MTCVEGAADNAKLWTYTGHVDYRLQHYRLSKLSL